MRHRNRLHYLFFLPIFLFFLTDCIEIGKVFDGNTKHKFGDYDIEERQAYKHYLNNKSLKQRERDREIVRRMQKAKNDPALNEKKDEDTPWLTRTLRHLFRAEN